MSIDVLKAPARRLDKPPHRQALSLVTEQDPSDTLHCAPQLAYGGPTATGKAMETDEDGNTRLLPSGLVTFVFTDIEASTRLYKALGEEAALRVFDRHNEALRAAWAAHRGHEIHTEGDSFFVVFEDPNDAVAACVEVQRRLVDIDWPEGGEVRVRIGVHGGLAAPRYDDYMALAVHQAARVMSAANGGQILVTDSILERLTPLDGATVVRAGTFRLRDFDQAPALHRIDTASIPRNDRPPRATPANHHNLVQRLNSFVGRDADIVAVNGLLERGKAVTLVGLGGMGKTRLATEVGLEVAPTWKHGAWMVELAKVVDPELIADEVAAAIGVASASAGDRWREVIEFIGDKSMLLILDNVEHLIERTAALVPDLLRACPNCAVLCTSREPLNCQGEFVYRVRPLELSFDVEDPTKLPSVELFIDRAKAVAVDSVWPDTAVAEVLQICQHLDGLPLAIEIAAAQISVLQLSEIREGLGNRFRLLRSRDRALPERQRTMEGLLGWSYRLLNETEQRAFRRLAVFAGSFSIDAAEAALASDGLHPDDVPELIWTLVDKSLIAADLSDSATRYRMFESVQHYAMRLLIDNDDPLRAAHALGQWLLNKVAPWHVNDRKWLGDLALELANVRSVVDLVAEREPELAQQLMCSIARHHDSVQSYRSGIDEIVRAASALPTQTPSRVALLVALAELHLRAGDQTSATAVLDQAEVLETQVGAPEWDDVGIARTRGEIATRSGDFGEAIRIAEETLARDVSPQGAARLWSLAGIAHASMGNNQAGFDALQEALAFQLELKDDLRINFARGNVAEAAWRLGDTRMAAVHQAACLNDALALGQQVIIAYSFIMASRLAAATNDLETAVRLQALAESMLEQAGHKPYADESEAIRGTTRAAEQALGDAEVASLISASRELPVIDGAALAHKVFASEGSQSFAGQPFAPDSLLDP